MVEVIAVACLAWQRVMQQRTIKAVAVCMSTSMRTVVNLRAPQRDSSFLYSSSSAKAHVDHCWQQRGLQRSTLILVDTFQALE
ncbi:uncharacterized [Tachysurus ichikawai]